LTCFGTKKAVFTYVDAAHERVNKAADAELSPLHKYLLSITIVSTKYFTYQRTNITAFPCFNWIHLNATMDGVALCFAITYGCGLIRCNRYQILNKKSIG